MTTLLAVYGSDGYEGRCDARCYDAKEPECDCVCGGRNHGAGLKQAVENTRQMAETMLNQYAAEHNLKNWHGEVSDDVWQLPLFEVLNEGEL